MTKRKDGQERKKAERNQQSDKESRKKREPRRCVSDLAVRNEQREYSDGDGRKCDPEPCPLTDK